MDSLIEKIPWYSQAKLMVINSLVEVDPEKAEIYYQEGIEQGGADSHTIKEILEYLLNQERYEEAIPYYNKLIQFEPERYDYRIDLAKVYYLTNQIDSAIDQVNIINAYNPLLLENEAELINGLSAT